MISLVTRDYKIFFDFIDTDSGNPKTEPFSQRKRIKAYLFELDTEIKSIIPRANYEHDTYAANIEVHDDKGMLFLIEQKPSITPSWLGANIVDIRSDLQEEFFKLGIPRKYRLYRAVCCVDPRIIMAHTLVWWRCPLNDEEKMDALGDAFTPPPSYQEAERWLIDNQFIGENALHENREPGRSVYPFYTPKTFKNLPEKYLKAIDKICEFIKNDNSLSKEEKELEIKRWRIPKE